MRLLPVSSGPARGYVPGPMTNVLILGDRLSDLIVKLALTPGMEHRRGLGVSRD